MRLTFFHFSSDRCFNALWVWRDGFRNSVGVYLWGRLWAGMMWWLSVPGWSARHWPVLWLSVSSKLQSSIRVTRLKLIAADTIFVSAPSLLIVNPGEPEGAAGGGSHTQPVFVLYLTVSQLDVFAQLKLIQPMFSPQA